MLNKKLFWDLIRPFHSPFTKALRKRFGRNYSEHPEMELPKAYDAIQFEVERRLHRYLHCDPSEIKRIAIVGANTGGEIHHLIRKYPNATFDCFEPSPRFLPSLEKNWGNHPKVNIHKVALSQKRGTATFYELPMDGNGSLLEPDLERWASYNEWHEKSEDLNYNVETSLLDDYYGDKDLDLLWVDVQGAEMDVLLGGRETLRKTRAIFLEVTLAKGAYKGSALFSEIDHLLIQSGFTCCGQGVDPWNFTGAALWISAIESKICEEHPMRNN